MANWIAIGVITATLEHSVRSAVVKKLNDVVVTTGRPRRPNGPPAGRPTVNIFLYSSAPDPTYRNEDLRVRARNRGVVDPSLVVNLFYLISFFGKDDTFVPELLAGAVLAEFHSEPILTGDRISQAVDSNLAVDHGSFGGSRPEPGDDQRIQVTPMWLSLEESTNFLALLGSDFSTTIALEVSPVLLN